MSDIRIDVDAIERRIDSLSDVDAQDTPVSDVAPEVIADVQALIKELRRQHEVNERWSSSWQAILSANAAAWQERVAFLEEQNGKLIAIIEEGDSK